MCKMVFAWLGFMLLLVACGSQPNNHPYPHHHPQEKSYFSSFSSPPKTLDPAKSYSANEWIFISQIYEPPLQYHYLKRPYRLTPLTLTQMPQVAYIAKNGKVYQHPLSAQKTAFTRYTLQFRQDIFYQPHPAFAKDKNGHYRYLSLNHDDINNKYRLEDFHYTGTRQLLAQDYQYEIKRLADPKIHSPIYGVMANYIVGLKKLHQQLQAYYQAHPTKDFVDLRQFNLAGVKVIAPLRLQITIKGKYPQFIYWLAMPFFSPIPWQADQFYHQAEMEEHNITWDWYPVGTGPFYLQENNPHQMMVLVRNPHYHPEYFPKVDKSLYPQLAKYEGQRLPLIDKAVFTLEKESLPRWNKFLQGYYDSSSVQADSFDQVIHIDQLGQAHLTEEMQQRGLRLYTTPEATTFYLGFNMLDPIVGGDSQSARDLRQALAIALDYEEFISIFLNGRAISAHSPLPPGILGHQTGKAGINPYVFDWVTGRAQRKAISEAKQLLVKAGYKGGINPKTKQPLVLNYDTAMSSGPEEKARLDWMRKQFAKLGIELNVRATQYNRFQEKVRAGSAQIFSWGWHADYPDPENFLFLLYGANGKVKHGGENAVNYDNPEYDRLFEKMRSMVDGPEREAIIAKMIAIVRHDAPWAFGFHPRSFVLSHAWQNQSVPHAIANNVLKYKAIDVKKRNIAQRLWNKANWWPVIIIILFIVLFALFYVWRFYQRQHRQDSE